MTLPFNQAINQAVTQAIVGGQDTVAAPGAAQALNASVTIRCRGVTLQAPTTNGAVIRVGASNVVAGSLGITIAPGASQSIPIDDIAKLFIVAAGAGDVVDWILLR